MTRYQAPVRVNQRDYGHRLCTECPRTFHARTKQQLTCSAACAKSRNRKRRAKWERNRLTRTPSYLARAAKGSPRPLHGPKAHPYLVAFRAVRAALDAVPIDQRAKVHERELAQVAAQHGPDFAGVIAWALTENQRQLCVCGCGATARPGNRFIQGHGSRAPGWAKRASA